MINQKFVSDKIIIASDIHGIFARFNQFAESYDGSNVVVLGDIINNGYTQNEARCVRLLRNKGLMCIKGNHDDDFLDRFTGISKKRARAFQKTYFNRQDLKVLCDLPDKVSNGDILYLHNILQTRKIKSIDDAQEGFSILNKENPEINICFLGHYHHPIAFSYDIRSKTCKRLDDKTIRLERGNKYLINPGSLGLCGDYIIYDKKNKYVERMKL